MHNSRNIRNAGLSDPGDGRARSREIVRLRAIAKGHFRPPLEISPSFSLITNVASVAAPKPYSKTSLRRHLEATGSKLQPRIPEPLPHVRILTQMEIEAALSHIRSKSAAPLCDEVRLLLSFDAGLSAPEIAALHRSDIVREKKGELIAIIVRPRMVNEFEERVVNLTPRLRWSLQNHLEAYPAASLVAFEGRKSVKNQSPESISQWFNYLYRSLGLTGATARSGPTTYRAVQNPALVTDRLRSTQDRYRSVEHQQTPRHS